MIRYAQCLFAVTICAVSVVFFQHFRGKKNQNTVQAKPGMMDSDARRAGFDGATASVSPVKVAVIGAGVTGLGGTLVDHDSVGSEIEAFCLGVEDPRGSPR